MSIHTLKISFDFLPDSWFIFLKERNSQCILSNVLYDQHNSVNTIKEMYSIIKINLSVHPHPSINRSINLSVNLSINQSIYELCNITYILRLFYLSIDISTLFHSTFLLDIFYYPHLPTSNHIYPHLPTSIQSVIRAKGTQMCFSSARTIVKCNLPPQEWREWAVRKSSARRVAECIVRPRDLRGNEGKFPRITRGRVIGEADERRNILGIRV